MARDRDRDSIPLGIWLGFLAAAVLSHGLMLAPSSAALGRSLRERVPQKQSGVGLMEFDMVEPGGLEDEIEEPLGEDEELVLQHRANHELPPEDTSRIAEVNSRVDEETKAPNGPDGRGGQPSPVGEQGQDGAQTGQSAKQAQSAKQDHADSQDEPRPDQERPPEEPGEVAQALVTNPDGAQATPGAQPPAGAAGAEPAKPAAAGLAGSPGVLHQTFGTPGTVDVLDEVPDGSESVVNSKQHRFASFFNRIRSSVGDQWRPQKVHDAVDPNRSKFGDKRRTTVVRVQLDDTGQLITAVVERSCGAKHLDEEARRAMLAAAPFLNPPRGLATDGRITFRFGFILDFDGVHRIFRYRK